MPMKKVQQTLHQLVLPKRHDHRVHVRHHHPLVWQEQEKRQEPDHATGESECDFRPASIAASSTSPNRRNVPCRRRSAARNRSVQRYRRSRECFSIPVPDRMLHIRICFNTGERIVFGINRRCRESQASIRMEPGRIPGFRRTAILPLFGGKGNVTLP